MSKIIVKKISASLVPTPKLGRATVFIDTDGKLKIKYDDGSLESLAFDSAGIVDKNFQNDYFATDTAIVTHSLGKMPSVIVMNLSNNKIVEAEITYDPTDYDNKLTVVVSDPMNFRVICN